MSHEAFISYSSKDETAANALCAGLSAEGISCWIAPRDVTPGASYGAEIVSAIRAARVMVLLFTANSNSSQHVLKEVERATRYDVPVVPVRTEEVQPSDSMEYFLSTPHWLNAMEGPLESHLSRLAEVVRDFIESSNEVRAEGRPEPLAVPVAPRIVPEAGEPLQTLSIPAEPEVLRSELNGAVTGLRESTRSIDHASEAMKEQAERVYRVLHAVTGRDHRITYDNLTRRLTGRDEPTSADVATVKHFVGSLMRNGYLPGVAARPTEISLVEEYFSFKTAQRGTEKDRVAHGCMAFVDNGMCLLLDAGSTTLKIAELLGREIREGTLTDISIVCFSPPHLERVLAAANDRGMVDEDCRIQIYSPGGRIRLATQAIVFGDGEDEGNLHALQSYVRLLDRETIAFVGANGITAADGFTTKTRIETCNKQTILSLATRRVIVADSVKIGQVWASKFADLCEGITLITDDASDSIQMFGVAVEGLRSTGCEVVLC